MIEGVCILSSILSLYEAVREKLGAEYTDIKYNTMKSDVEGQVGVYLYEGAADIQNLDDVEFENIKIQVQVNAYKSEAGIRNALDYLRAFVDRIEYENSAIEGIEFISAIHTGPKAIPIGKNEFGIMVCKSTVELSYTLDD